MTAATEIAEMTALEAALETIRREIARVETDAGAARERAKLLERSREGTIAERDAARLETAALLTDREALRAERAAFLAERDAFRKERDAALARADTVAIEQRALLARIDGLCEARQDAEETARRIMADRVSLESRITAGEEIIVKLEGRVAELTAALEGTGHERAAVSQQLEEIRSAAATREDDLRALLERTMTRKGVEKLLEKTFDGTWLNVFLKALLEKGKLPEAGFMRSPFQ